MFTSMCLNVDVWVWLAQTSRHTARKNIRRASSLTCDHVWAHRSPDQILQHFLGLELVVTSIFFLFYVYELFHFSLIEAYRQYSLLNIFHTIYTTYEWISCSDFPSCLFSITHITSVVWKQNMSLYFKDPWTHSMHKYKLRVLTRCKHRTKTLLHWNCILYHFLRLIISVSRKIRSSFNRIINIYKTLQSALLHCLKSRSTVYHDIQSVL